MFLASSANTSTYGGAIRIAPDAVPTDGLIDLCVIDRVTRLRAFALLPTVLLGRHQSLKIVRFMRTKRLTIESDERLELWADGEKIGTTPVCVEAVPGAVRVPVRDPKANEALFRTIRDLLHSKARHRYFKELREVWRTRAEIEQHLEAREDLSRYTQR